MKSFFPTTLITLLLLAGSAFGVQAQTKDEGPMTNAEVIKLVKAGFKEKTIVLIIASRIPNFDLSSDRMIQLKRAGVSENIIVAMLARQEGNDVPTDDSTSWADDPFFNSKVDPKDGGGTKGSGSGSDGSTNIFGSSSGSRQKNSTRTGNGSASGESNLSGSATVRILRPPSEAGGNSGSPAKLEKTKSLTNESIVEMVEAGFSEGTIIRRIEQSPVEFDLATDKLDALRKKRVSDKVIVAMKAAMGEEK
ncbi:MAG TPA: hypothetical protein VK868_13720 [Pyrinomonadaceae bacterium]|nr:hypothetical protein [Pyrinomonadaceae bacterium]